MLKKLATAALLSSAALCSFAVTNEHSGTESFINAVNNTVEFGSNATTYGTFTANGGGSDFKDVITFTGLTVGQTYDIRLSFSGQLLGEGTAATLQGSDSLPVTVNNLFNGWISLGYLTATSLPDGTAGAFVFTITAPNAGPTSNYNGQFYAAAVPEPTAAAMLLAGFAVMGFIAMRRRRQD